MTPLIPIAYLNEACFLSMNEDDKKYKMCLEMSQDDLKDIIGKDFYDEIVAQYSTSFTSPNDELYEDYIKKFLAWQTYFNYLKFANTNATPTGIREFSDENSTIASDIKMYSLEKNVLARANKYKFDMVNFLSAAQSEDSTAYPLYMNKCKEYMSFSITAIDKCPDSLIKVNKAVSSNE